jgi:DNA-binding NtrC family response regulator
VRVPALAQRREDTAALVPLLLRRFAEEVGVPRKRLSREAHDALLEHSFPGNVRELQNILYRATVLSSGEVIHLGDLAESLRPTEQDGDDVPQPDPGRSLPDYLADVERRAMDRALAANGGIQARAARSLGMHPRVFRYKARQYGLANGPAGGPQATDPSLE